MGALGLLLCSTTVVRPCVRLEISEKLTTHYLSTCSYASTKEPFIDMEILEKPVICMAYVNINSQSTVCTHPLNNPVGSGYDAFVRSIGSNINCAFLSRMRVMVKAVPVHPITLVPRESILHSLGIALINQRIQVIFCFCID
jgi:hypothetical protein